MKEGPYLASDREAMSLAQAQLRRWGEERFLWREVDLGRSVLSLLYHGFYRQLVRGGRAPNTVGARQLVGHTLRIVRNRLRARYSPHPSGEGGLLLLPAHPNHVNWLSPVIEQLKEAGWPTQIILPFGVDAPSKYHAVPLGSYFPLGALRTAVLGPVVGGEGEVGALLRYRGWPQLTAFTASLLQAVAVHRPKALLVLEDHSPWGLAAAAVARVGGFRSINLQHGWMPTTPWTGSAGYDHWAVFGEYSRDVLLSAGELPERVAVTGPPHFDRIARREFRPPAQVASDLGLPADQPERILFVSQWGHMNNPPEIRRASLHHLVAAVMQRPGSHLIIKKHLVEYERLCEEVVAAVPGAAGRVTITREYDLISLLGTVSLVVTQYSTVGYEASLAGLPVMVINLTGAPDVITYVEEGIALGAYDVDSVGPVLHRLLDDPEVRQGLANARPPFLARHCAAQDGGAADRLARLIIEPIKTVR